MGHAVAAYAQAAESSLCGEPGGAGSGVASRGATDAAPKAQQPSGPPAAAAATTHAAGAADATGQAAASPSVGSSGAADACGAGDAPEPGCLICMAPEPSDATAVKGCGHTFCYVCIHQWGTSARRAPTCPVCRGAMGALLLADGSEQVCWRARVYAGVWLCVVCVCGVG